VTLSGFQGGNPAALAVTLDDVTSPLVLYVGVAGGNNNDEIDVQPDPPTSMELLAITFDGAVVVDSIDINKLFLAGVRGDNPTELGRVCGYLHGSLVGCLDFSGTETGRLTLSALFGGQAVDELRFTPIPTSTSTGAVNSDYGISGITVTRVPEPGTFTLLGTGLLALAAGRRRLARRRHATPS
jgi:hypothetical protein